MSFPTPAAHQTLTGLFKTTNMVHYQMPCCRAPQALEVDALAFKKVSHNTTETKAIARNNNYLSDCIHSDCRREDAIGILFMFHNNATLK